MSVFDKSYAEVYDLLHLDKSYQEEIDFVCLLAEQTLAAMPSSVIDLACGTGRHLELFARKGLYVHGNDISAAMVKHARNRLVSAGFENCEFTVQPMQTVQACPRKSSAFDLATAFYTAVGYLTEDSDVRLLMSNVLRLVKPGGCFFADFWNAEKIYGVSLRLG